jgi:type IV pilus assembly protein PilY1
MKKELINVSLSLALLATSSHTNAEDIDLFLGVPPGQAATPNVLFIIDNTANWSTPISGTTRFDQEISAIANVLNKSTMVNADGSAKVNIGIELFGESPVKGGYIRAAIRPFSSTGSNTKSLYINLVNSFDKNNDKGANALYGYSLAEAYRYFKGQQEYVGADVSKRDYHNNTTGTSQSKAIYALSPSSANAFTDGTTKIYNKPSTVAGCAKNFIIFISNGPVDNSDKDDTSPQCFNSDGSIKTLKSCTAKQLLQIAGGSTSAISISPSDEQNSMADEWARFLNSSDLAVKTYTIDIGPTNNVQGRAHSALLQSMADVSTGERFLVNSVSTSEIEKAIDAALSQILAVNSVFASVSLPASASTQSTYLNQVFIGMFRPDGSAKPRWDGNLKQYKLGLINNQVKLVYDPVSDSDTVSSNDLSAINTNTGFITQCARSYWTPTTADTYWDYTGSFFKSTKETGCSGYSLFSNYPDGQFVEKGAQAQTLRSSTTRTVKTCSSSNCNALVDFNGTNVSQTDLGAGSASEATQLIQWAKGLDVDDENSNSVTASTTPSEMRPSAHGDIVHSRPVVVNYGTNEVVVYYSGNDGMLRAINGNRSSQLTKNSSTYNSGQELWSFVPPEFFSKIKRIRDNTTLINYPGTLDANAQPKPYGMDGPLTAYQGPLTTNGANKVFLYGSMRRGGRTLYGFDVTDETSPSLKWRIGCPNLANDTGCTTNLTGMGQTWSPPSLIKSSGYGSAAPMIIMGGGYDTCEDYDNGTKNSNCTTTKGNHVYVFDANDGSLLRTLDTDRAVIAGITVVTDSSGYITYGYTADLGGNIYRIAGADGSSAIGTSAPSTWTITKIASLGCSDTSSCNANRKFMFAPDVVKYSTGLYYLLVGSGDREKPIYSYTATQSVQNYFFMVKDNPSASTWLSSESTNCNSQSVICLNSLTEITNPSSPPSTISEKGWKLTLTHSTDASGVVSNEQVVTSAITVANVVTFSTAIPELPVTGSCSSGLGNARVYNILYKNAQTVATSSHGGLVNYQDIAGDGLPPSPVAGKVILDDGTTVPFIIGASPDSPLQGGTPGNVSSWSQPRQRVYWYIQQ